MILLVSTWDDTVQIFDQNFTFKLCQLVQFQDTENKFPTRNILENFVRLIFGTNLVTGMNPNQVVFSAHRLTSILRAAALGISILVMMLMPINPSYYQAILAILGKSYSNAMMVQLNSRMYTSLDVDALDTWKESTRVRHPQCHRASQLRIQCPENTLQSKDVCSVSSLD